VENPHVLNVWFDPTHDNMDDADYFGFDYVLSVDEAKALWPEFSDDLNRAKQRGQMGTNTGFRLGNFYNRVNFQRPMVHVSTVWMRHQSVSLGEDDALAGGHVTERMVPQMPDMADPVTGEVTKQPVIDEAGQPAMEMA